MVLKGEVKKELSRGYKETCSETKTLVGTKENRSSKGWRYETRTIKE